MAAIRMISTRNFHQYDGSNLSEIRTAIEVDPNTGNPTVVTSGVNPVHVLVSNQSGPIYEFDLNATDWVDASQGSVYTDAYVAANFVPLTNLV